MFLVTMDPYNYIQHHHFLIIVQHPALLKILKQSFVVKFQSTEKLLFPRSLLANRNRTNFFYFYLKKYSVCLSIILIDLAYTCFSTLKYKKILLCKIFNLRSN